MMISGHIYRVTIRDGMASRIGQFTSQLSTIELRTIDLYIGDDEEEEGKTRSLGIFAEDANDLLTAMETDFTGDEFFVYTFANGVVIDYDMEIVCPPPKRYHPLPLDFLVYAEEITNV
jgi:hypothetical protein